MLESGVYVGLGFFAACLLMLFVANAVWRRAVRLTTRRVLASLPVSLADVRADRDQLRAEFALSTRKLEVSVEELRSKSQVQLIEIARKNEQIRLLLAEVRGRTEQMGALQDVERALRADLLKAEAEHGDTLRRLRESEAKLDAAMKDLAERETTLGGAESAANQRRVEIAALQTNVARLQTDTEDLKRALGLAEADRDRRQASLAEAEGKLAEARARVAALESELAAAETTARTQAEEVGRLQARIVEMSGRLDGQLAEAGRMSERIRELSAERDALDEQLARRTAKAELRAKSLQEELDQVRAERADYDARFAAERAERERLAAELAGLQAVASDNWDRERVEHALLRERMNDLAAEITAMTAKLEGDGTLDRLIEATAPAEGRAPGGSAVPPSSSLADRVRALRRRAVPAG
jgi:chromosome segregation ATPase